jgi:hypothetical protein
MPANHGLGANDMERLAPPSPPVGEPHPEETSKAPNCGWFDRQRIRTSCCRSGRFSSARSERVLSDARSASNRASTRDIAPLARTPLGHRPVSGQDFCKRQAAEHGELLSERQVLEHEVDADPENCAQGTHQGWHEVHSLTLLTEEASSSLMIEFWQGTGDVRRTGRRRLEVLKNGLDRAAFAEERKNYPTSQRLRSSRAPEFGICRLSSGMTRREIPGEAERSLAWALQRAVGGKSYE